MTGEFRRSRRTRKIERRKLGNVPETPARTPGKKRPFYHIVAADSRAPRDGRFIERLGFFNPLLPKDGTQSASSSTWTRIEAWIVKGAQPSDRVMRFLDAAGVAKREKRNNPERAIPRKERKAAREEKQKIADAAETAAKTKSDVISITSVSFREKRTRSSDEIHSFPRQGSTVGHRCSRPRRRRVKRVGRRDRPHLRCPDRRAARHSRRGEAAVVHAGPDGDHGLWSAGKRGRHAALRDRSAAAGEGSLRGAARRRRRPRRRGEADEPQALRVARPPAADRGRRDVLPRRPRGPRRGDAGRRAARHGDGDPEFRRGRSRGNQAGGRRRAADGAVHRRRGAGDRYCRAAASSSSR